MVGQWEKHGILYYNAADKPLKMKIQRTKWEKYSWMNKKELKI